jgi:hypothetical protein
MIDFFVSEEMKEWKKVNAIDMFKHLIHLKDAFYFINNNTID